MSLPITSLLGVLVLAAVAGAACTGAPRPDRRCGSPEFGMARCLGTDCCSKYSWCGNETAYCNPDICKDSLSSSLQGLVATSSEKRAPVVADAPSDVTVVDRSAPRGMVMPAAIPNIGPRVSITSMSLGQLTAYRDAWARLMDGGQNSAFYEIAQDHGVPNFYCPHGNEKFLPWHRRYIDRMEEALQVPLAYWDWTQGTLPAAFGETSYINGQGVRAPNPLFSGILPSGDMTSRNPRLSPSRFQAVVAFAQQQTTYSRFTRVLESVHDNVHGSVGRTMSMVSIAAFDPIFWAHHAFVDFQWWVWQLSNPNALYSAEARGPLQDSIGTFPGAAMIDDQSGWLRGRSSDQLPRASTSSIFSEPQMFLTLKNVPSLDSATEISVLVDDFVLARDIRFGMHGMKHRIEKDYTLYVDPDDAVKLWKDKNIQLEQIPNLAKVWLTRDGVKIRPIEGVPVEVVWMTTGLKSGN